MFIVFLLLLGVSWFIQQRLKSKFREYSQIGLSSGLSGSEVAHQMLQSHGIYDVEVTCVPGKLTDHYHPGQKTVNLSEEVYHGRSAAAAAIAAHECGHAVQHATAYGPLEFRSAMVPLQAVAGRILNFLFIAMLFGGFFLFNMPIQWVMLLFIGVYTVMTLFSLITLPVEFDASRRALAWIEQRGIVNSSEYGMAKDALRWAALTYVVAAVGSLVWLLYYVMMFLGMDD
ncbi:MAG: zinc metallopeptidase [Bacteroidota bacterium]